MQDYLNLVAAQKTYNSALTKCSFPTAKTQFEPQEETLPNNILMFYHCVVERVSLEIVFSYGCCLLVKTSSFFLDQRLRYGSESFSLNLYIAKEGSHDQHYLVREHS